MEKIWLKQYPKNVPVEIDPDRYTSLVDVFTQSCQKFQTKFAFTNMGVSLTYDQLDEYTREFAAYLQQKLRLKKGDRFAIMMPNILQFPIAMFGALRAGLTVTNINPLYTSSELAHQLKDAGATAIIVLANFAHVLAEALPETDIQHVIVAEIGDLLPYLKGLIINFAVKYIKKMIRPYHFPKAIPFKTVLAEGKKLILNPIVIKSNDIAFLQYTGGTTGVAKGAELTHRNMVANVLQCFAWVSPILTEGKEKVIVALPLYHIFSLTICGLIFLLIGGEGILITNPRDIKSFIKDLVKVPFTVLAGVNTLFNALLNQPKFTNLNFSHLKLSVAGGMALQKVVADKWQQVTSNCILEGYGLTEASPVITINQLSTSHFTGSIGLPIPSTDITILDEHDNQVPIGEVGELCVKGPQVMAGYWCNPEETKKVFTVDGWLRTGDIVRIDEQGFIYLVDRKKDVIIVSGFNVYPNEVEDVLVSHPGVLEAGVIGVPDGVSGEDVKAFIVKKDSALTEEEIREYVKQHLTGYKRPKYIVFKTELPKTNVGKILRRELRNM